MARTIDSVRVGEDGAVEPENNDARYRLRRSAGRYRLMSDTPGLLVLRRLLPEEEDVEEDFFSNLFEDDSTEITDGGRVIMAGEILSAMTLFQMIEIIGERRFQGDMHVFSADGASFRLAFDQGALRHAASDHPDDRFGELLVRKGLVDRTRLDALLKAVTPDRRLGQVCLDKGVVDREQLFALLGEQVQEAFFRTLLVLDGSYVFTSPDASQVPADHTVHLVVRALLMEGIRRLDEMELFRQMIPGSDVCLRASVTAKLTGLDGPAQMVLGLCDGRRTIADIGHQTGLGEFETTRAAYYLVKGRQAEIATRQRIDEDEVKRVTRAFSAVMQDVFDSMSAHGGLESAREMLSAWVSGCGYDTYLGSRVTDDGTIDTDAVLRAIRNSRDDDPISTFRQVAHELTSFALFCAGTALPRDEALKLSRDVNRRLQAI